MPDFELRYSVFNIHHSPWLQRLAGNGNVCEGNVITSVEHGLGMDFEQRGKS